MRVPARRGRRRSTRRSHGLRARRGRTYHGHRRPGVPRHDELAYPGELARVWQRRDRRRGRKAARAASLCGNGHQSRATDHRACRQRSRILPRMDSQRSSSSPVAPRRWRPRSRSRSSTTRTPGKPRANKIISRWNAYHGATMGALGATDWLGTRHISEPGVPGYSLIPGPSRYRNPFGMEEEAYFAFLRRLPGAAD